MTRKRKTYRKIFIGVVAVVMICSLVFVMGVYVIANSLSSLGEWYSYDKGCLEWWGGPDDPAAIEQGANLTLPPSTQNLFAHSVAFQDCFVFVSFDMASSDLDSFLASTYISKLDSVAGSQLTSFTNLLQGDVDWSFDDETEYLYGTGHSESSLESQSVVMEQKTPATYTVYVVSFLS